MSIPELYCEFFKPDGSLDTDAAVAALDFYFPKLDVRLRNEVARGNLQAWYYAGLPDWDLPETDIEPMQRSAIVSARSHNSRPEKLLLASCASVPQIVQWICDDNELRREWHGAHARAQLSIMDRLHKTNEMQWLKRTDADGDYDDKEYRRQLKYKQELDREASEQPVQIAFKFGE